ATDGLHLETQGADIIVQNLDRVQGEAGNGIDAASSGGTITVSAVDAIVGTGGHGILAQSTDGDVSIQGSGLVGGIQGTQGDGIHAASLGGNLHLGDAIANGDVTGSEVGIRAETVADGSVAITAGGVTSGMTGEGILATSAAGAITALGNGTGEVDGGFDGIYLGSNGGDVTAGGFVSVSGDRVGLNLSSRGGDITVNGIGTVTSIDDALYVYSQTSQTGGGDISIQDVGNIGGITGSGDQAFGALVFAAGGDIHFGDSIRNGAISGTLDGLYLQTTGTGDIVFSGDSDISSITALGLYAHNDTGNIDLDIAAGTITGGGGIGLRTVSAGGATSIDIGSAATIQGVDWGVMVDAGTDGTTIVANQGLITEIEAQTMAQAGGDAFLAGTGTTTLDNTGTITGRVGSDGAAFTFNNESDGVWNPGNGDSVFNAVADILNNRGTIRLSDYSPGAATFTAFTGLETFNNLAGGVIDMATNAPEATDTLTLSAFAPHAGSAIVVNFDAFAVNGAGDSTPDTGLGTADTIVAASVTPAGVSMVNVVRSGVPLAATGAVAVIDTPAADVGAPGMNDVLTASSNYVFGNQDPSTFGRKFTLVDDGAGGVFLLWQPALNEVSLGGYSGGNLGGTHGVFSSQIAATLGAVGGGIGNQGASGGGAASMISDMAMLSTQPRLGEQAGFGDGSLGLSANPAYVWRVAGGNPNGTETLMLDQCSLSSPYKAWAMGEGYHVRRSGGAHSDQYFGLVGLERDMQDLTGAECGRTVMGAFFSAGTGESDWSTGRGETSTYGGGLYARFSKPNGLYGSVVGGASWSDRDLRNDILISTAKQDSTGFAGVATLGWTVRTAESTYLDLRGYATLGELDGGGFTDSLGLRVSGSDDDVTVFGGSVGLYHAFDAEAMGFVRAGARKVIVDNSVRVANLAFAQSQSERFGSLETGIDYRLSDNASISATAFGDFSSNSTGYGGTLRVTLRPEPMR
ncbi:MAG: autotransporter outer membrane beta-barrel domain-containing protein, partial [Pseudomonadales bacterium]|nr:autotransporter outer membrane beta-barrel domain-containing protein [Pseudomonadales bacterium]